MFVSELRKRTQETTIKRKKRKRQCRKITRQRMRQEKAEWYNFYHFNISNIPLSYFSSLFSEEKEKQKDCIKTESHGEMKAEILETESLETRV